MTTIPLLPSRHWFRSALSVPLRTILEWYRMTEERAVLRDMPADRLADIGLTKRQVEWEVTRPFWKATRDI